MPTKNIESRNEKMSSREQLDKEAGKQFLIVKKLEGIRCIDRKGTIFWVEGKAKGKTREITVYNERLEQKRNSKLKTETKRSKFTLRFGPEGYEESRIYTNGEREIRKLKKEDDILKALDYYKHKTNEVLKVKQERDRNARRDANRLADAETQKERDDADQNLASSLEDIA